MITKNSSFLRYLIYNLMLIFILFGHAAPPVKASEIILVVTHNHENMGKILAETLASKFPVKLDTLSLIELLQAVQKNKADLFIVSFTEIYKARMENKINLSEIGEAAGPADIAEKIHLTTLKETGINEIRDLYYKLPEEYVSLGQKKSATEYHALDSIEAQRKLHGPSDFSCNDKIKCQNDNFNEQHEKLLKRKIKAFYFTGQIPVISVQEVAKKGKLNLANIPEDVVTKMNNISQNTYIPTTIDMNDYGCGPKKVETGGIPAIVGLTKKADQKIIEIVTEVLITENPFYKKRQYLPIAFRAIPSVMAFNSYSLKLLQKHEIKLKR